MDTVRSGMEVESAGRMASMRRKMSSIKPAMQQKFDSLRHNPAVLGGVASAAGLAVGLVGRWLRHRAHAPTVIVIEAM